MTIFDDFFIRAILAAIGIAIMAGPVGCFVIWQRLSYFGDTMAHSALLGVSIAFLFNINISLSVFITAMIIAAMLLLLQRHEKISNDSILGILAHSTLAIGMLIVGFMSWVRIDLMSYLFGDILAASKTDLLLIWLGCAFIVLVMIKIWRQLLNFTINSDIAICEQKNAKYIKYIFMLLLALMIAIAMKLVGILLITAMLIIPAATAQRFASSPARMAIISSTIGVTASITGLISSYYYDTRSGASIVVALFTIFLVSRVVLLGKK